MTLMVTDLFRRWRQLPGRRGGPAADRGHAAWRARAHAQGPLAAGHRDDAAACGHGTRCRRGALWAGDHRRAPVLGATVGASLEPGRPAVPPRARRSRVDASPGAGCRRSALGHADRVRSWALGSPGWWAWRRVPQGILVAGRPLAG